MRRTRSPGARSARTWRGRDVAAGAIGLVAAALLGGACAEGRACFTGDFEACTCADGRAGFAACDVAKDAYGACGSCGLVPGATWTSTGGGGAGGATEGGGAATTTPSKAAFMEDCAVDADCETGICHVYAAKGPKCTLHCNGAADCPPPSTGCNNMGFCKAP